MDIVARVAFHDDATTLSLDVRGLPSRAVACDGEAYTLRRDPAGGGAVVAFADLDAADDCVRGALAANGVLVDASFYYLYYADDALSLALPFRDGYAQARVRLSKTN